MKLTILDEVASTNEVVKAALREGKAEGLVVRARRQTGGYGRQGRGWESPEGGLYMSLLLRPDVDGSGLATLSLVVGLAVQRALEALAAPAFRDCIQVKWPNDVVFVPSAASAHRASGASGPASGPDEPIYRKLCGISLEACGGGVCVGVGINVFPPEGGLAVAGKNTPAYVADLMVAPEAGRGVEVTVREEEAALGDKRRAAYREQIIADVQREVLARIFVSYGRWRELGFSSSLANFASVSFLDGREVRLEYASGKPVLEGVAEGVDERGRLLVRTARGIVPVASGEAHIVPAIEGLQ